MPTIGYPGFSKRIAWKRTIKRMKAAPAAASIIKKIIPRGSPTLQGSTGKYAAAFTAGKRAASREAALRATTRKTVSAGAKVDWFKKNLGISKGAAGNIGIGLMLAMMVKNMIGQGIETSQTRGMQEIQAEHMRATQGIGGEDAYYASALPELQAERQMAQQALMQTILGGQGMPMMPMQVPGERVIGGAGGRY